MDCIPLEYEINPEKTFNQFKKFFSIEGWADISLGLKNEEVYPEEYRCEAALECIPHAYKIDGDRGVGQFRWFYS